MNSTALRSFNKRDVLAPLDVSAKEICKPTRLLHKPLRDAACSKRMVAICDGLQDDALLSVVEGAFDPIIQKAVDNFRVRTSKYVTDVSDSYNVQIELTPENVWIGERDGVSAFEKTTSDRRLCRMSKVQAGLKISMAFDFEAANESRAVRLLGGHFARRFNRNVAFETVTAEGMSGETGYIIVSEKQSIGEIKVPSVTELSWNCSFLCVDLEYLIDLTDPEAFKNVAWELALHAEVVAHDVRVALDRTAQMNTAKILAFVAKPRIRETILAVLTSEERDAPQSLFTIKGTG